MIDHSLILIFFVKNIRKNWIYGGENISRVLFFYLIIILKVFVCLGTMYFERIRLFHNKDFSTSSLVITLKLWNT